MTMCIYIYMYILSSLSLSLLLLLLFLLYIIYHISYILYLIYIYKYAENKVARYLPLDKSNTTRTAPGAESHLGSLIDAWTSFHGQIGLVTLGRVFTFRFFCRPANADVLVLADQAAVSSRPQWLHICTKKVCCWANHAEL